MTHKLFYILLASAALSVAPLSHSSAFAQQDDTILPKPGAPKGETGKTPKTQGGTNENGGSNGTETQMPKSKTAPQDQGGESNQSGTETQTPKAGGTTKTAPPSGDQTSPTTQDNTAKAPSSGSTKNPQSGMTKQAPAQDNSQQPQTTQPGTNEPSTGKTGSGTNNTNTGNSQTNTTQPSGDTSKSSTSNVNITVEQQTQVRQVVKEVHVQPVHETDFTAAVGTAIPRKIRLQPLPPRIVEIVPQYKAYRFFILDDGRIVIVDPTTFTIVYIIEA